MKILAPHANTEAPDLKQVLFVLQQGLRKKNAIANWMQLRQSQVHFRANPRSYDYMLDLAKQSLERLCPGCKADLLVVPCPGQEIADGATGWLEEVWTAQGPRPDSWPGPVRDKLSQGAYDAVVFLYPDALGLGWRPMEKAMKKYKAPRYLVMNGRRRVFYWDASSRYALAWRRCLARGWPAEMIFGAAVLAWAGFLAAYDSLRHRNKGLI